MKYIRDLHNADSNVMSQSPQVNKDTRRYVGIIMVFNGNKYCIPISSGTKEKFQTKKNQVDLIKIPDSKIKNQNGAPMTLAVLNINNMIPVNDDVITKVDLRDYDSDSISQRQRKGLLRKELKWCRENYDLIKRRVSKVYSLVTETPEKSRNLTRRCCDFKKLEGVLEKYISKHYENDRATLPRTVSKQVKQNKTHQSKAKTNTLAGYNTEISAGSQKATGRSEYSG